LTKRICIIGSNSSAVTLPGWNDYEVQQFERSFLSKGVVQGIGSAFAVSQRGAGANMSIDVAAGRALIEITNTNVAHGKTYLVYFDSDATENAVVDVADPTNPRKDRVILRVDVSQNPDGSAANIAIIDVLPGTPAGSPSAPATPANAISLAIIDIPASDTAIGNAQITDDRSYVQVDADVLKDLARVADLASTTSGKGASQIGVEDTAGHFTGDTVEEVLDELQDNIDLIIPAPTGGMIMWTTDTAPTGWLLCYGQAVSRTTYAALFAVLGTTFGSGDGSTTFNVPDMRGRLPLGQDDMGGSSANRVTATQADTVGQAAGSNDANHSHAVALQFHDFASGNTEGHYGRDANDAVTSSESAMPPYLTVNYIIKT